MSAMANTAQPISLSGVSHGCRGRAEEAVGLLPRLGEGLCSSEWDSDLVGLIVGVLSQSTTTGYIRAVLIWTA